MAVLLTLHIDSFGIQFHIEQTAINEFEKIQNKMKKKQSIGIGNRRRIAGEGTNRKRKMLITIRIAFLISCLGSFNQFYRIPLPGRWKKPVKFDIIQNEKKKKWKKEEGNGCRIGCINSTETQNRRNSKHLATIESSTTWRKQQLSVLPRVHSAYTWNIWKLLPLQSVRKLLLLLFITEYDEIPAIIL